MEKTIKILPLIGLLLLGVSCETTGEGFQGAYQSAANRAGTNVTPEGQAALDRMTSNGRTLPDVGRFNRGIRVGDLPEGGNCDPSGAPRREPVVAPVRNGRSPFIRNVAPNGQDPQYGVSLKNHPRPERGCYPVQNVSLDQAKRAIAAQNFTYGPDKVYTSDNGPNDAEVRTLGAAVLSMQYLNGGTFNIGRPANGASKVKFGYCDHNKSSQQFDGWIRISRKGGAQNGLSVAQYVHEWGHLIGNSPMPGGSGNVYNAFLSAIGGKVRTEDSGGGQAPCLVSRYADNRSNEHFAEVLTAFVTEPSILLNNKSPGAAACRKAYDFFEKVLFKKGERARECM